MRVNLKGKNVQITDGIKDYAEKRFQRLEKYFEKDFEVNATISVEKDLHKIDVVLPLSGFVIKGEDKTRDMYNTIDNVIDKLERQIRKYKTRINRKGKQVDPKDEYIPAVETTELEMEIPEIVKTKRFAVKPMSKEEAVLQMGLLDHSFFVFLNADTEEVNVIYRRNDGQYGLIEPDFN
ncbi:MAG: ribosome-associated translation inhibitor RaiA [Eubacteriales bacterium]|nr:ribosome-associated translation inhibitor RaiA [Eubacteriales bacterium]